MERRRAAKILVRTWTQYLAGDGEPSLCSYMGIVLCRRRRASTMKNLCAYTEIVPCRRRRSSTEKNPCVYGDSDARGEARTMRVLTASCARQITDGWSVAREVLFAGETLRVSNRMC